MKYVLIPFLAAVLVILTYIGFSNVLNQPAKILKEEKTVSIEFVDITYDEPDCKPLTNKIRSLIDSPQACQTAADCTAAYFGCPFGCKSYVTLTNEITIRDLIVKRKESCSTQCKYRCSSGEIKRIPSCINNLCGSIEIIEPATDIKRFINDSHPLNK